MQCSLFMTGITETETDAHARPKAHPRRSRSSSCLVSLMSPTADCFTVNATTSARVHPQAQSSSTRLNASAAVGAAPPRLRDGCRTSARQPQYFILADPPKHNASSSNVDYGIGARPAVKWMTSGGRRRCLSSDRNIEHCDWDASTPVQGPHPVRRKQPSGNFRRNKLRATSTDIPHSWSNANCPARQYEQYYKPQVATVHSIYQTMDRNPDVLKNCAICHQHASGSLGGTMTMAMPGPAAGDTERNVIFKGNDERF